MNYDLGGRLPSDTTHGEGWCVKATPQEHAHTHTNTHLAGFLPVTQVSGRLKSKRR